MKNFYIIANRIKDKHLSVAGEIAAYLEQQGCSCSVETAGSDREEGNYHYTDPGAIPKEIQCVIVLGGDGTLLQAARDIVGRQIPLLGINLGTLGYLAEIDRQNIFPALDRLMRDEYEIEGRMMLTGTVYRGDRILDQDIALNDIVIGGQENFTIIQFNNYVNGEYLNTYRADGIIIATPTGSTGYSLSAGGPLISPSAALFLMTPLAPHTLNTRSIVFPPEDTITVEIGRARDGQPQQPAADFAGDTRVPMETGDRIEIRRAELDTLILKIHHSSFLEILSRKMSNR